MSSNVAMLVFGLFGLLGIAGGTFILVGSPSLYVFKMLSDTMTIYPKKL